MNRLVKKVLIRICALVCSAILIFLSPCAKYLDASRIDQVNAAELVIVGEGAAYVAEWLIALLATVGLGGVAYENRDAIVSSYKEYLEAQIDTEMFIIDSVKDACVQVYDKASNTIQKISWQTLLDSMQEYHDIAVDNLTGIYVKYCPQLLSSFNDYTTEVLSGDVYVSGVSDAIITYDTVTPSDVADHWNGKPHNYSIHGEVNFNNDQNAIRKTIYDIAESYSNPVAGYFIEYRGVSRDLCTYLDIVTVPGDSVHGYGQPSRIYFPWNVLYVHDGITEDLSTNLPKGCSIGTANIDNGDTLSFNANFPVFANKHDMDVYFTSRGAIINALNCGTSVYDSITDNSDLPTFYQTWQQELWERVANTHASGIGSYGSGTTMNDWADNVPWISLESLMDYALSLLDTYQKLIDDILNGIYDSNEDIPDTYSEAWEDTITDCWDHVEKPSVPDTGAGDKDNPTEGENQGKDEPAEGENPGKDEPVEGDDEKPQTAVKELAKQISDEYKQVFQCEKFADELERLMKEKEIAGERVSIHSETEFIFSDKYGLISKNGWHYAIKVGDIIFDNLNPEGVNYDDWLWDLGIPENPAPFDIHINCIN